MEDIIHLVHELFKLTRRRAQRQQTPFEDTLFDVLVDLLYSAASPEILALMQQRAQWMKAQEAKEAAP
ncbi:MAG: hypothetical protein LBU11_12505 [Zoogloeaceae bacterium]|jgi:hypothetical protein|nr:hypothetical protein [Zoogloeaceae bacterium]